MAVSIKACSLKISSSRSPRGTWSGELKVSSWLLYKQAWRCARRTQAIALRNIVTTARRKAVRTACMVHLVNAKQREIWQKARERPNDMKKNLLAE